jgi:hypothetical protein
MRQLLAAALVLGFAVALLSRSVSAEPPPAMEPRQVAKILPALKAKPTLKAELASVRFYSEVFGRDSLQVPIGDPLESLGPWGDNGALLASESAIGECGALDAKQLSAASAILKDYGDSVPVTLRAFTLGQQGKKDEAAKLFTTFIDQQLPAGKCPGEHPMYSHRRINRIGIALQCLKKFAPGRDVKAQEKQLERATTCANNNHAVG